MTTLSYSTKKLTSNRQMLLKM